MFPLHFVNIWSRKVVFVHQFQAISVLTIHVWSTQTPLQQMAWSTWSTACSGHVTWMTSAMMVSLTMMTKVTRRLLLTQVISSSTIRKVLRPSVVRELTESQFFAVVLFLSPSPFERPDDHRNSNWDRKISPSFIVWRQKCLDSSLQTSHGTVFLRLKCCCCCLSMFYLVFVKLWTVLDQKPSHSDFMIKVIIDMFILHFLF